jgi:ABC-2 type transport system ATP-binding protein
MTYAVEIKGLRKSFHPNEVVKGIDFKIKKGEIFALLGTNGAGKTTTIHMLSTLLKPDSGTALIAGFDLVNQPEDVRKKISLTGQFASLDDGLTGMQNIILLARLYGYPSQEAQDIAHHLLSYLDLGEAKDRLVENYSGGMRRRLDIAASIITKPELIFLDEPTTGLDPQTRIKIWEVIRMLVSQGTTILLTTQYLEEADQLADRLAVLDHGKIIAEGTPDQLKTSIGIKKLTIQFAGQVDQNLITPLLMNHHKLQAIHSNYELHIMVQQSNIASEVIRTLLDNQVSIEHFSLSKPSLEEAFLTLTSGKERRVNNDS